MYTPCEMYGLFWGILWGSFIGFHGVRLEEFAGRAFKVRVLGCINPLLN